MTRQLPPALARIADGQHGVVTRKQALRAGLNPDAVDNRVRSGTWRPLYRGVYLVAPGPPSHEARLWAAVLYCGRGALISHESAAELHGLVVRPASPVIHVSIPGRRRITGAPDLCVHRTGRPLELLDGHRDPPHTSIWDTLLDLADAAADFGQVCQWFTDAIGKGKVNEHQLRYSLAQRTKARWRRQLADIVTCAVSGDHSVLEYRYTRDVERAHGLPESVRQVPFTKENGQEGRRDRVYQQYQVIIELDGKLAHPAEENWADKCRDRAAAAEGKVSARYGWSDVDAEPCKTAAQVAQILRHRGWMGSLAACFPGCQAPSVT